MRASTRSGLLGDRELVPFSNLEGSEMVILSPSDFLEIIGRLIWWNEVAAEELRFRWTVK